MFVTNLVTLKAQRSLSVCSADRLRLPRASSRGQFVQYKAQTWAPQQSVSKFMEKFVAKLVTLKAANKLELLFNTPVSKGDLSC